MPPIATEAIVLHTFDYLETSRILRLITREAGVISVLAKGARRNRAKYGSAVDLFAQGEAQIYIRPTRDLHTIATFDITDARFPIAQNLTRFAAASALAELILRIGRDDPNPALFDTVAETFTSIAITDIASITSEAIGGGWRIVSALGFAPTLDECANCHTPVDPTVPIAFAHTPGGVLCDRCAPFAPHRRTLPSEATQAIRAWLAGNPVPMTDPAAHRAHQRLLREFVQEHLTGDRHLRAFTAWETSTTPSGMSYEPSQNTIA